MQKLNANTKIIADTERKYQIAEAKGKTKYQILQKDKIPNFIERQNTRFCRSGRQNLTKKNLFNSWIRESCI